MSAISSLLLVTGIFFWSYGYIIHLYAIRKTESIESSAFIKLPSWLYYLCGAPRGFRTHNRTITAAGMGLQIGGMIQLFMVVLLQVVRPAGPEWCIGLLFEFISMTVGLIVAIIIADVQQLHLPDKGETPPHQKFDA